MEPPDFSEQEPFDQEPAEGDPASRPAPRPRPPRDRPGPPPEPGAGFWASGERIGWIAGLVLALSAFMDWYAGKSAEGPKIGRAHV